MSEQRTTPSQTTEKKAGSPRRKRSRLWRLLKWTLLSLLILIIILVGAISWVAGTRTGTEFAWHQVEKYLPESIHIDSLQGRLIGPLEVKGVDYKTDAMTTQVRSISFDMDFSAIWHATVHIKHLDVAGVDYTVLKETPEKPKEDTGPLKLPDAIKLPVTVIVDRISASDITAVTAPGGTPFKVDQIKLTDARLDNQQWRIGSLTGHGPLFDLDANAKVTPYDGYGTKLHATASLKLPDYAPLDVTADIAGTLKQLNLNAEVAAPYNLTLSGQVRDVLDDLSLDADIKADKVHAQKIAKTLPKLVASAQVHASGTVSDLAVKLSGDVDSADYGRAELSGTARYQPDQVSVDGLTVRIPATDGRLTVDGKMALAGDKAMNWTIGWDNLAWPLSKKPNYKSDQGQVKLTGTLDDYNLNTQLVWQVVGQTKGKLAASGNGSLKAFDLKSLEITGGPGHITGHAKTQWSPTLKVQAHVQGSHINPGAVVADVPGDFDLNADLTASQKGKAIHAAIQNLTAKGTLRHQPLSLKAKAQYLGDYVNIDTLHLVSGSTTADVAGRLGWTPDSKLDAHWSIDATDLSTLLPGLAGMLKTQGQVSGLFKAPNIKATLVGRDIDAFGNKVKKADLNARVDWSGASKSSVDLDVADIDAAGQEIKSVTLNLDGTPAAHRLTVKLDSDIAKADIAMQGALDKKNFNERYTLQKLTASYGDLPAWSLAGPATGAVSAKAQSVDNACLTSGSARVCLKASHDSRLSKAHIDLSNFNYDYAKTYFPEGMNVTGSISGQVDATIPTKGALKAKVDLATTAGRVSMTNPTGETVTVLDMRPGKIQADMANNGVKANVNLPLAGGDGIRADVTVAPGSGDLLGHGLGGQVHLSLKSMDFLTKLSPEVNTFDGNLSGDMNLSGTVAKPRIQGRIDLKASKIALVSPGLTITDVDLSARGQGASIAIKAAAKSGGGSLHADGNIAFGDQGQIINLAIKGNKFQMVHIPDVTAYVSPDLKIHIEPHKIQVNGSVTIPKAAITPKNLPESGVVTVSSDQVIVTEQPTKAQEVAQAIDVDVKVILGDKVSVKGFGLKANLEGALRVVQRPGEEPTGTGTINIVDGSYRAYGQNLNIEKGRILFAGGPVGKPGLDITAVRYPNKNIKVGVRVRGTLTHPELTLFSDPNMGQSEQLSWLLLGRSLDSTSGQQSSMVARAALALGSSTANKYLQNFGNKIGVDQLGIGSTSSAGHDGGDAALMVGKYLSPKLYIGYGMSLFNHVSTVTMRYTLSSEWTIETESSSEGSGGDIIWHFNRD